ncbi:MAG: HD domain-containing protein [Deltaproteobacteria bacterium]|nr:HD domain-containing protein [Deltaproteobacteria bacterium]
MPENALPIPGFVRLVLNRLKTAGYEAYIVGGAVRDSLLKREITDWDMATSASQEEIRAIFRDKRQFTLKHGTVTLVHSGLHFDVTTFRGEKRGLESDLSHRDFTINAMALVLDRGLLIDPWDGLSDIRKRVIRAPGEPEARFREDPLRLLRAVRLAAELKFRIHKKTFSAIKGTAFLIASAAPERVRDELMKILLLPEPSRAFNMTVRTGLLKFLLPELLEGHLKRQNRYHRYTIFRHILETVDRIRPDPVLRLAALLHDIAKPRTRVRRGGTWRFYGHEKKGALMAGEILNRLRFSNQVKNRVVNLVRHHMIGYDSTWSDAAVRRLIRRVGTGEIQGLLILRRADLLAHGLGGDPRLAAELEMRVKKQIRLKMPIARKNLALNGRDVMEITGLSPGPEVGRILKVLNERVMDNPELNNRDMLTALLRDHSKRGRQL